MGDHKARVRGLLRLVGKSDTKVAAVFGSSQEACHEAVAYLRRQAPEVPVFLFSIAEPLPETAALCENVSVRGNALALLLDAERRLWRYWVALSVGVWSGERRYPLLKWAPFLMPPFRVLLLNGNGDFFPGTPQHIVRHTARLWRDRLHAVSQRAGSAGHWVADLGRSAWRKAAHLLLLGAASTLRAAGYPHRQWFARRRGGETLRLSVPIPANSGIAVFTQKSAHWDGAALERFAKATNSRWILWQKYGGEPATANGLVPPFSNSRTFAVSRQTHFRAWKPLLFPTAAFRTLQPGETAQVLAPLSHSILVDREKLLQLGIPRCQLADTAWMLCFWKAAAAGFRSFSVGQEGSLSEQPDLPVTEAEFLLRLLTDSEIRNLRPAEPELARGCISFAPSARPLPVGPMPRLKVLLVTPFLPFPLSHGGAVRIYNLCRALAWRVDFVLIALREKDETVDYARLKEIFREVYVVDIDERPSADLELPEQVRGTQSQALRALIAEVSTQWNPDVLQIEYTHMAAFRDSAPQVPAVLVEHDLTFSLYRQFAEGRPDSAARQEYQRWLNFERRWLADFDGVWTVCAEDCRGAIEESGRAAASTFVVPNGVDVHRFLPSENDGDAPEILYVGSFRHSPNVLGFDNLRREIMPRVWKQVPNARLRVVAGKDFERFWNGQYDSRITLHGFVEDLRPLYATASVVVTPLGVSAGTNIKVLEAMACGKPVVSTPVGCAGLGLRDDVDAVIRRGWDEFSDSVCGLLNDPAERSRIGQSARRTVEARFSWNAIAEEAYRSYLKLAGQTTGVRTRRAAVG